MKSILNKKSTPKQTSGKISNKIFATCLFFSLSLSVQASGFNNFVSGSDNSDGVLNLDPDTPTNYEFDPEAMGIDTDGDGVFHFASINIGSRATVNFRSKYTNKPIYWLSSGDVTISGNLVLAGENGANASILRATPHIAAPGPGGYHGGTGMSTTSNVSDGFGPLGGLSGDGSGNSSCGVGRAESGRSFANTFVNPPKGGSGGGGNGGVASDDTFIVGSGGGAGGGAILIASSSSIILRSGNINARGGDGSAGSGGGGGGSIRLVANTIDLPSIASLSVTGGGGWSCFIDGVSNSNRNNGKIRVEGYVRIIGASNANSDAVSIGLPQPLVLPSPQPEIKVIRVAGIDVPSAPSGTFTLPDIIMSNSNEVTFDIEAQNIPLGESTIVTLRLVSFESIDITVDVNLSGTVDNSTATVSATVPPDYSLGYVRATWDQ